MAIVVGIMVILLIGLAMYIAFLQRQLRNINRQLNKRLTEHTRQPISLDLLSRELNTLAIHINKCLKAEETLRLKSIREEKRFKELIANISHDLRTPLTAIKGYQQLLEKGPLTEDQKHKLQVAQKNADELGVLIDHFFEYSYLVNAEPKLNLERVNLTNLVAECLAESINSFEASNLIVYWEEVTSPVFVLADQEVTTRIIRNLIRNCIIHSAGDIHVRLSTEQTAVISFRNPVKNASAMDAKRIFERFYTADKARNKSTGLGLSIVKLLVEQIGGSSSALLQDGVIEITVEIPLHDED
ncbi:two-component sensor histidine kinase [Paenibacillus glacialis]|uniref:histidine kinase n=1 Tax=Paenibacillus glacialis TaxID=494026 RepID=A0A162K2J0_9BACL|nr:two-component sensor histidine kinase [Paenibacillus glacialis]